MPSTTLPTWPLLLFGVLEPAMLIWAAIIIFSNPSEYVAQQVPSTIQAPLPLSACATSITLMMGNVFLLLAGMAVVCCFTIHAEMTKRYLLVVAAADLGHIYAAYCGMGGAYFWDFGAWNSMAWGNVGASAFLHVNRLATAFGLFGGLHRDVKQKTT